MAYDDGLAARVRAVLPADEPVSERHMFGGLAFMLCGHMFCGVVKDTLMVRLGPEAADRALEPPHDRHGLRRAGRACGQCSAAVGSWRSRLRSRPAAQAGGTRCQDAAMTAH